MYSSLLDLVRELNTLNDDNLADRVITNSDVQWCLSELQDILEAEQPTLTPPNEWVSVEERLPEDSECWRTYIVTVNRSHWPTSSYDTCDAPYDEQLVASAQYDSKQKIWHLPWDEQLNALIQADDAPLNGDFVTHWMLLPAPPESRRPEGEADA